MGNLLKIFLPAYLAAYFFAAFFWRSYVVWKRTNVNPVVFKGSDDAHDFIGRVFKLRFTLIVAVVLAYSLSLEVYRYSTPIMWLEYDWLKWAGMSLLLLTLAWTVLAQAQMGESWRIGVIDFYGYGGIDLDRVRATLRRLPTARGSHPLKCRPGRKEDGLLSVNGFAT
jgi:hypothetical protein